MHDNGWVGVVYEIKEMNWFVGGAAPPGEGMSGDGSLQQL